MTFSCFERKRNQQAGELSEDNDSKLQLVELNDKTKSLDA